MIFFDFIVFYKGKYHYLEIQNVVYKMNSGKRKTVHIFSHNFIFLGNVWIHMFLFSGKRRLADAGLSLAHWIRLSRPSRALKYPHLINAPPRVAFPVSENYSVIIKLTQMILKTTV